MQSRDLGSEIRPSTPKQAPRAALPRILRAAEDTTSSMVRGRSGGVCVKWAGSAYEFLPVHPLLCEEWDVPTA